MKPRHVLIALAASLTLGLAACTAPAAPEPEASTPVPVVLSSDADPMYRAVAAVYAAQLEDDGFEVTVLEGSADPVGQVRDETADAAITAGQVFLARQADDAPAGKPGPLLTREQVATLAGAADPQQFAAVDISPGDLGRVLVMSRAEMKLLQITDFADVAAECGKLDFVAERADAATLDKALDQAKCTTAQVDNAPADELDGMLRHAEADAVVMSRARAMIADEGFVQVPNTAELFSSKPVLAFTAADADPGVQPVIERVTGALNAPTLLAINRMVQGPGATTPEQVARYWQWLQQ